MALRGEGHGRSRGSISSTQAFPPTDPARRVATWSLLMVAVSAVALMIGGAVGMCLQFTVFD